VSWLFGHEGDFLNEMLRKAAAGGPLTVFRQTGSPTPIVDAAGRLVTLAAALRDGACAPPILHVAGGPPASRRAWVTPALQAYQAARRETASEILEVDPPANRPLFSALDTTLSTEFFGSNLDWRSAAARAGIAAAG
jgi:dTDP-4-dehydrorhamnose reductase